MKRNGAERQFTMGVVSASKSVDSSPVPSQRSADAGYSPASFQSTPPIRSVTNLAVSPARSEGFIPLRLQKRALCSPQGGLSEWVSEPASLHTKPHEFPRQKERRASAPASNLSPLGSDEDVDDAVDQKAETMKEMESVAIRLEELRRESYKELTRVQIRILMFSLIVAFFVPIILLIFTDGFIITPPFVIGVLILTTVGDMNIDRVLKEYKVFSSVIVLVLTACSALLFVAYDDEANEFILVGEMWPNMVVVLYMTMSGFSSEFDFTDQSDQYMLLPSQLMSVYIICWMFAEGSISYDVRHNLYSRYISMACSYLGGLVAVYLQSRRTLRNRGPTRTLFIVLCIYILTLGASALTAGLFPEDDCSAVRYRPPRNCATNDDRDGQLMFIIAGALYFLLVPAVYYWRRHIFGTITWILWMNSRAKTGEALTALFATEDSDINDLAREGAACFRCVRMSSIESSDQLISSVHSDIRCATGARLNTVDYFVCVACHGNNAEAVKSLLLRKAAAFANEYGREPTFWIDSLCRNRSDSTSLQYLPVFVAGCKRTLVILGDGFFDRLGCMMQLFVAMTLHSSVQGVEVIAVDESCRLESRDLRKTIARFDVSQTIWPDSKEEEKIYRAAVARSGGRYKFNNILRGFEQHIEHELAKRSGHIRKNVAYNFADELSEDVIVALGQKTMTRSEDTNNQLPRRPSELERNSIILLGELGIGEYGIVRKGLYNSGYIPEFEVAVKMLMPMPTREDRQMLLREAALTSQFDHPNVIGLVGVVTIGDPIMMVLQYCAQGSLQNVLRKLPIEKKDDSPGIRRMCSFEQDGSEAAEDKHIMLASYCLGLAKGMEYLASRRFVHRDVASRNVLVDAAGKVKVSDFGMSKELTHKSTTYFRANEMDKMPIRWASPEVMQERKFSEKSDVWAYGVTAIEVFELGKTPYESWTTEFVVERVMDGYIPPLPELCASEYYDKVICPCFAMDPSNRPSFAEIRECSENLLSKAPLSKQSSFGSIPSDLDVDVQRYLSGKRFSASVLPCWNDIPPGVILTEEEKALAREMSEESLISLFRRAADRESISSTCPSPVESDCSVDTVETQSSLSERDRQPQSHRLSHSWSPMDDFVSSVKVRRYTKSGTRLQSVEHAMSEPVRADFDSDVRNRRAGISEGDRIRIKDEAGGLEFPPVSENSSTV